MRIIVLEQHFSTMYNSNYHAKQPKATRALINKNHHIYLSVSLSSKIEFHHLFPRDFLKTLHIPTILLKWVRVYGSYLTFVFHQYVINSKTTRKSKPDLYLQQENEPSNKRQDTSFFLFFKQPTHSYIHAHCVCLTYVQQ